MLIIPGTRNLFGQAIEGKWLQSLVAAVFDNYTASNGMAVPLMIISFGILACLTVSFFNIEKTVNAVIVGAFFALFPSTLSMSSFICGIGFTLAAICAILSALIIVKYKKGWIASVILLVISLGIYQAYIAFYLSVLLIFCIFNLLDGYKVKKVLLSALKYVAVAIVSIGLYYLILQIILKFSGLSLSSYKNIDSMTKINISSLPNIFKYSYLRLFYFFINDSSGLGTAWFKFLYRSVVVLSAAGFVALVFLKKTYKKPLNLIFTAIALLLLPYAVHIIAILSQNVETYWNMIYPFVIVFVFFIKIMDELVKIVFADKVSVKPLVLKATNCLCILSIALSVLLSYNWGNLIQKGYRQMEITYENTYATTVILASSILGSEDYSDGVEMALIGSWNSELKRNEYDIYHSGEYIYDGIEQFTGVINREWTIMGPKQLHCMLDYYLGYKFNYVDEDTIAEIEEDERYREMPVYPQSGSIQKIDNVLVVKLSEVSQDK